MSARAVSGVRHSDRTRKKSATPDATDRNPMPRPKFPSRLCPGAIDAAVVIAHHAR